MLIIIIKSIYTRRLKAKSHEAPIWYRILDNPESTKEMDYQEVLSTFGVILHKNRQTTNIKSTVFLQTQSASSSLRPPLVATENYKHQLTNSDNNNFQL